MVRQSISTFHFFRACAASVVVSITSIVVLVTSVIMIAVILCVEDCLSVSLSIKLQFTHYVLLSFNVSGILYGTIFGKDPPS